MAIQQLHERNLGFEFLRDEVVDVPHLIELYREIGLSVPSDAVTSPQVSTAEEQAIGKSDQDKIPVSSLPPVSASLEARKSTVDSSMNGTKSSDVGKAPTPEPSSTTKETPYPRLPITSPKAQPSGKAAGRFPEATILQGEPSASLPSRPVPALTTVPVTKPLERKDYIARLLAAKEAVKSSTAPKTPKPDGLEAQGSRTPSRETPPNALLKDSRQEKVYPEAAPMGSSPPKMVVSDKFAQIDNAEDQRSAEVISIKDSKEEVYTRESTAVPVKEISTGDISQKDLTLEGVSVQSAVQLPKSSNESKKAEIKDPVQTELVRRRLEALRKSAPLQRTAPANTDAQRPHPTSSIPHQLSISTLPPAGARTIENPDGDNAEIRFVAAGSQSAGSQGYGPATSFFTCGDSRSFSGLPGLSPFTPSIPGLSFPPAAPAPDTRQVLEKGDEKLVVEVEEPAMESTGNSPLLPTHTKLAQLDDASSHASSWMESRDSDMIDQPTPPETDIVPSPPPAPVSSRKRATAADFIDGPEDRSKRQNTSNDPIQLVIEVSDDEDNLESGEELELDPSIQESSRPGLASKGFRDVPPLSDFPSRPRSNPAQAPGFKAPNSKGLAQREEQIRLLNQKIAEMEQRKRVKQAASGGQSQASSSPAPGSVTGMSQHIEKQRQALDDASSQLEAQKSTIAATKSALQEKLGAERDTHARIVARAEKERREAALAETNAEREVRLQRKAALEAALPKLDTQIQAAEAKLEDMRKQQLEIQEEIQRGHDGKQALVEELNSLLALFEAEDGNVLNEAEKGNDDNDVEEAIEVNQGMPNLNGGPALSSCKELSLLCIHCTN